jgi:hypothetical protein
MQGEARNACKIFVEKNEVLMGENLKTTVCEDV